VCVCVCMCGGGCGGGGGGGTVITIIIPIIYNMLHCTILHYPIHSTLCYAILYTVHNTNQH
jgi:hypothetical protein